jgi:hypothetical protein
MDINMKVLSRILSLGLGALALAGASALGQVPDSDSKKITLSVVDYARVNRTNNAGTSSTSITNTSLTCTLTKDNGNNKAVTLTNGANIFYVWANVGATLKCSTAGVTLTGPNGNTNFTVAAANAILSWTGGAIVGGLAQVAVAAGANGGNNAAGQKTLNIALTSGYQANGNNYSGTYTGTVTVTISVP